MLLFDIVNLLMLCWYQVKWKWWTFKFTLAGANPGFWNKGAGKIINLPERKGEIPWLKTLKAGPQLCLCATWPRRPAGYNNSIPIPDIKAVLVPLWCAELECYCCNQLGLRGQVAHKINCMRTVLLSGPCMEALGFSMLSHTIWSSFCSIQIQNWI